MERYLRTLAAAAFLSFLAGCEPVGGYFSDYVDAAGDPINLIENRGFGIVDWIPDQIAPFMAFDVVDSAEGIETTGLPSGFSGDITRLEIMNLMPNGDFEGTALGGTPAGWVESGTVNLGEVRNLSTGLDDRYLHYELGASGVLSYDLQATTFGLLDGPEANQSYVFRFDIVGEAINRFKFDNAEINAKIWTPTLIDDTTRYEFPLDFISELPQGVEPIDTTEFTIRSAPNTLSIGAAPEIGNASQKADVDNIRIVRSDMLLSLRTHLPYVEAARPRQLALVSGTYRFSIYVRRDLSATNSGSTAVIVPNRYMSTSLTFGVHTATQTVSTTEATSSDSTWEEWTKISLETFMQIDRPSDTSTEVLTLSVSATDITGGAITVDAGSILIAAPSLEFLPDGS